MTLGPDNDIYLHTYVSVFSLFYVLLFLPWRRLKQKRDKKMRMKSAANAKREHSARLTYSIEQ